MDKPYWHKQKLDQPLFADLIWSRPENKRQAGKLLIIGGNLRGFSAAATAYAEAGQAGVGTRRVILPAALQKTVSRLFPEADYAPSNVSGSFARAALADWLEQAAWADGVLLAGDFSNNSETGIVIESLARKYDGQITLCGDTIDFFIKSPQSLLGRTNTTLVVSFGQLQKLAASSGFTTAFTSKMDLLHLIDALHEFCKPLNCNVMLAHQGQTIVAAASQVSTTPSQGTAEAASQATAATLAAHSAVWWLQNPAKPFEALTTALVPANLA